MLPHSLSSTLPSSLSTFSPLKNPNHLKSPFLKTPSFIPKSTILSVSTSSPPSATDLRSKPSPAENARSIMELSSSGTLSTLTHDGWPIGVGAQFVVDAEGSPALCLKENGGDLAVGGRSSFHVQLEQSRLRTAQCTVMGSLKKPDDGLQLKVSCYRGRKASTKPSLLHFQQSQKPSSSSSTIPLLKSSNSIDSNLEEIEICFFHVLWITRKKLCAKWEKTFGEEVDSELVYIISVEKVLQIEDFKEEGIWVNSSEYLNAHPDPLRNFAEKIVDEMNSQHVEDVQQLCKVYVDAEFQVTDTKIIWVDRLGFDLYMYSDKGVFAARIAFPREVTDEKGVKSSFNSMSHLAWEIEKSYALPDFEKVKCLKKIR